MKDNNIKSNHSVVRINIDNNEYHETIIKMLKTSDKITIISETAHEIVVCSKQPYKPISKIAPKVNLIKVNRKKSKRKSFFHILFNFLRHYHPDFSKIVSISGFLINK